MPPTSLASSSWKDHGSPLLSRSPSGSSSSSSSARFGPRLRRKSRFPGVLSMAFLLGLVLLGSLGVARWSGQGETSEALHHRHASLDAAAMEKQLIHRHATTTTATTTTRSKALLDEVHHDTELEVLLPRVEETEEVVEVTEEVVEVVDPPSSAESPPPPAAAAAERESLGDYRRRKLDGYVALRREQCDEAGGWVSIDMARENLLNSYLYGNHSASYAHEERHLSMMTCGTEEAGGESGWQIYRLGPYVGTGGYDWHQTYVHPLPNMSSKAKFLTGKLCGPVSMTGEFLGYPPIYSHHVHTKVNGLEHVLESHGDTVCSEENGGKACYLHTYPEGLGMPYNTSDASEDYLSLDFLQIDKRDYPAPPMVFFQEIAIKWSSDEDLRPISTGMLHAKPSSSSPFATRMVAQRPSYTWNTGKWLVDGKVVISPEDQLPWFHAHRPYFKAMWAFAASPEDLGLTSDLLFKVDDQVNNLKPSDYDYVWTVDGAEDVVEALRARVGNSTAGLESLRCYLRSSDAEKILERVDATNSSSQFPEAWQQNWKGNLYDRAGEVHCKPWEFKKGDSYTIVTLNGVHDEMRNQSIATFQHQGFWLVYETTGPRKGPNFEAFGTFTSGEHLQYNVQSDYLKSVEDNGTVKWLADGVPLQEQYGGYFSNVSFASTPKDVMRDRMAKSFKHRYYDEARKQLDLRDGSEQA
ncbi:hypothetical protein HOP50_14g72580 [Chloropicon primus]|uniref:Uncharacterized protein n=2 Tax=Chloropicon primus TaxID=1764295 RepID=A0A5B8MYM3_9CHLO|nr:hypothetical protein A3770_14p72400 [Chloropicon primus]UPR03927.1 hypothetical protein HOP50_14g72580 [Chloropicon primus]|eukprot:QDZ24722.1 hypothetical protein A3770_14p72400 [Chloropicon primus]